MTLALAAMAGCQADNASAEVNVCETGELLRRYGDTEWYVYGCTDQRSLVFVAAPGSPAKPFAFSVSATGDVEQLNDGERQGSPAEAAFEAIDALSARDIARLAAEIRREFDTSATQQPQGTSE